MKQVISILAGILILVSCNNASTSNGETEEVKDEVTALKKEVMKVHDRSMAEMSTLTSLTRTLAKTGLGQDSTGKATLYALKKSHNDMMDWMHNFKNPDEQDWTQEQKIEYLKSELQLISKVDEDTHMAIKNARALIEAED